MRHLLDKHIPIVKFHQIRFKIATVRAMTDRHRQTDASDLIICPTLWPSNFSYR